MSPEAQDLHFSLSEAGNKLHVASFSKTTAFLIDPVLSCGPSGRAACTVPGTATEPLLFCIPPNACGPSVPYGLWVGELFLAEEYVASKIHRGLLGL